MVIKPLEEDRTPATLKPFQVSLAEPLACSLSHDRDTGQSVFTSQKQPQLRESVTGRNLDRLPLLDAVNVPPQNGLPYTQVGVDVHAGVHTILGHIIERGRFSSTARSLRATSSTMESVCLEDQTKVEALKRPGLGCVRALIT